MKRHATDLVVSVADLLPHPGATKRIEREAVLDDVGISASRVPEGEPVVVDVELQAVNDGIVAVGTVRAPWEGECRRCLQTARGEVVSEWQTIPPTSARDEVGHHMTRRFAVASLEAGVHELVHRLDGVGGPHLVVLDRQRRPRGIVCALDVVAAVAGDVEADGESAPDGRRPAW